VNAERLALGQPSEIVQHEGEVKQTYEIREPDRLASVLAVLHQAGAIPPALAGGRTGEIIDAEDYEIHDDDPPEVGS
jgi:hypothetical protein